MMNDTLKEKNYPYASGIYQGWIRGLTYACGSNIPGIQVTDPQKFRAYLATELKRMDEQITEFSNDPEKVCVRLAAEMKRMNERIA